MQGVWRVLFLTVVAWGSVWRLSAAESLLLEAEDFQFFGDWLPVKDRDASAGGYLQVPWEPRAKAASLDALTAVTVDQSGDYRFWERARDFAQDRPKTRRFALLVDGEALDAQGGTHGREGFAWQLLGARALAAGDHLLSLRDTARAYGRCDALFITRTGQTPDSLTPRQIAACRAKPKTLPSADQAAFRNVPLTGPGDSALASLSTPFMRVDFVALKDAEGKPWIVRRTQVLAGGAWQSLPDAAGGETLFVQAAPKVTAHLLRVAQWSGAHVPVEVPFGGRVYATGGSAGDPYCAAPARRYVPRALTAANETGVELRYESANGESLPVRWSVDPDDPFTLRVQARLTAAAEGAYSLGFSAFQETARDRVEFVQLPPLYQFQRLPAAPDLLCNTLTPHPLALAQVPWLTNGVPLSLAVCAEPADLPFAWPDATNAVCGFSLLNSRAQVQPSFFSPVLGSPHSHLAAGETRVVNWRLMTRPAEWKSTLEAIVVNLMSVTDYREPVNASLTEAALNMIDLMRDDEFGGWNEELKGFYDIESATMGKHAAPLALLSAAVLSRSEAL